jgi:hypothetical protein
MPTFDQLSAEERAIIELVVQRGRSYDALSDVLQIEPPRVREMARDALIQLSPVTADRVDSQWRGQVADFLLGQQSGPESTATRGHLKRSEPARTWALSLLDSLSDLYPPGELPTIPDADGADGGARRRLRGDSAAAAERPRERERERERERKPLRAVEERKPRRDEEKPDGPPPRDLSPAARAALKRRRLIGAGALGVIVVVAVLAIAGVFSGGSSGKKPKTASKPAAAQQPKIVGQIPLNAVNGAKASGTAFILQRGTQRVLVVQAKLPPLPSNQRKAAYEVWLFNSPKDAQSIGAQFTDAQGAYQGAGPLPNNFAHFKFVDISREPFDTNTAHSGNSLLRGAFADLAPVQQPSGAATTPGATGTAPGGTATTPGTGTTAP